MKDLAATKIETQLLEFVDSSGKKKNRVFCRVDNIKSYIFNMLDKQKQQGNLTWHGSIIPENEIWIKFGGDHGKNSLKFTMQIANTPKPNSKHNTLVVAMTKIKDNHKNLKRCMSILQPQLEELSNSEWNGKKIRLFVFGDFDFLSKLYGISGAQGTYPYLWCIEPKDRMKRLQKKTFPSLPWLV